MGHGPPAQWLSLPFHTAGPVAGLSCDLASGIISDLAASPVAVFFYLLLF